VAVISRQALRAPETFDAWLDALGRALDALPDGDLPPCPYCGRCDLRLVFVAERVTRVGLCAMWSDFCEHGIRVSRVTVPDGTPFLPLDSPAAVLDDFIPPFVEIGPSGPVTQDDLPNRSALGQRIVRLLRRQGPLTRRQIADELDVSAPAVATSIRGLIDRGTVIHVTSGSGAAYDVSMHDVGK
jgi:Winged helix-turn-helix DNA-binding